MPKGATPAQVNKAVRELRELAGDLCQLAFVAYQKPEEIEKLRREAETSFRLLSAAWYLRQRRFQKAYDIAESMHPVVKERLQSFFSLYEE